MMSRRIEAEPGAIEHVRNPGQRMPIRGVSSFEGPQNSGPAQAAVNVKVAKNVCRIVEGDEAVAAQRSITKPRALDQNEAEQENNLIV